MKLLIISSNSPYYEFTGPALGGAEASLRIVAERFAERGHEVHFLTQGNLIGSRKIDHNGVEIHFIPPYRVPILGIMSQKFCNLNKKIYSSMLAKNVERIVKDRGIEIIHSYVTFPDTYTGVVVGKKCNIPVVQRIAGKKTIMEYYINRDNKNKINWTFDNVDHFFPISDYLEDELRELHRLKEKKINFSVIDIGLDVPKKKPKIHFDKKNCKTIITSVSSFKSYAKRQDIIIDAVEIISRKRRDFIIQFIGDGENLRRLKKKVRDKKLDDLVVFLGKRRRSEVLTLLKSTHIFIHASESEGLGKAVIEAMAFGLPIIASDVRAINDYIKNGVNGFLVSNDPESFADLILFLMDNVEIKKKVSSEAYTYALNNFQSKQNINLYEKEFSSLIRR